MRRRDHIHRTNSLSDRMADAVAQRTGSWRFIAVYLGVTAAWCIGNVLIWSFDRFPYQFYTFSVSVLAILLTALVLLAQNRQSTVDRRRDDHEAREVSLMFGLTYRMFRCILTIDRKQDRQLKIMRHQLKVLDQQHRTQSERLDSIDERLRRLLGEAS